MGTGRHYFTEVCQAVRISHEEGLYLSAAAAAAAEGSVNKGAKEKLGIFSTRIGRFDAKRITEGETSLEALASAYFLKEKTTPAKEQCQIIMEDVVASQRAIIRVVPGAVYPGPFPRRLCRKLKMAT